MRRRSSRLRNTLIFAATGWLFADLFIALAMGFLVANTVGQPLRIIPPTPTTTPLPLATATPKPALALTPITILVTGFDPQGVASGDPTAIANAQNLVKAAIHQTPKLAGKTAGIVLTFGSAPTATDTGIALQIAQNFNTMVMPQIGLQGLLFLNTPQSKTQYRDFFNLGLRYPQNQVQLDIYVFNQ